MFNLSGKVQRRDPSVTWHKNWWRQRYSWHPQTPDFTASEGLSSIQPCLCSAEKGGKHCCAAQEVPSPGLAPRPHTEQRGSLRRQDFSLNANTRCAPRKCPMGFFSHVIAGTLRFSEKNDALFSDYRKESTTRSSVTGVSKPHFQRQKFSHL